MSLSGLKVGTLLAIGLTIIICLMVVPTLYSNSLAARAQNIITDSTERIFKAMTIQRDVDELFSAVDGLVFALEEQEVLQKKAEVDELLARSQQTIDQGREENIFSQQEIKRAESNMAQISQVSTDIIKLKEISRDRGPEEAGLLPELNKLRASRYNMISVVTEVIQRSDQEFRDAMQLVGRSQIISWLVVGLSLAIAVAMAYLLVRSTRKIFELKNDFINIIAHDLRNPVTAIIGYLDIISTTEKMGMSEVKQQLKIVEVAAHRLRTQINNLLEVGRSEAGYVKVSLDDVVAAQVLLESVKRAQAFGISKGITVNYEEPADDSVIVVADKHKLADVFDNLISNAIKYNKPKGTVTVSTSDSSDHFSVAITDTGYGIPADKKNLIFKKYTRLAGSSKERVGGTGLGLYTVKLNMDQMQGSVNFTTKKDQGTTFTVILSKTKKDKNR